MHFDSLGLALHTTEDDDLRTSQMRQCKGYFGANTTFGVPRVNVKARTWRLRLNRGAEAIRGAGFTLRPCMVDGCDG